MTETRLEQRLARDGGPPARTRPEPPMFPGGMEIGEEEVAAVTRVLRSKNVFRYYGVGDGPQEVAAFEREFSAHLGAKHALAVNAGSSALICGLIGSGVGPGDEVIIPAYTWNATANAVIATGAVPVLAEVDDSLTLDPGDVEAKITARTKALLPVHMRGAPSDMDALTALSRDHGLALIEDVCQAAGATFRGQRLGTFGDAGGFSLQFNKIITTGEGGVLITDREDVYDMAIDVHDCAGSVRRGIGLPQYPGFNFRASELQGAVARVQLGRLDGLLERMRANQTWLAERVAELPGLTLRRSNDVGGDAGICLVALAETRARAADAVDALKAEGVGAMLVYSPDFVDLHVYPYWKPVLDAIARAGNPAPDCPRTLDLTGRAIHIDLSPLCEEQDLEELALAFTKVATAVLRLTKLKVGVVGGGLVAQAMHLPYLSAHRERFELAGLAEPSQTVRDALGARYGIAGLHADYKSLLATGGLDAVVVCSPAGTHAEVVIAALDAGLHVLVEKPMCITLADADAIIAARDKAGRVVQVGTMKRYDPAYERLLADLPESADELRYISVVVNDPEFAPYFGPDEIVRGTDIPRELIEATRRSEAEQVEAAVGSGDPDVVRAFSESFLGSLLHDLNAVHGLLERMGEPLPAEVVGGAWWNEGRAVSGSVRLANGSRFDGTWIQLLDTYEYKETISLFFDQSVRTLEFPSPWLKQFPTVYRRSEATGPLNAVRIAESYDEAFSRELVHFHSCIVDRTPCRTLPEQARIDIDVLTQMFLAASQ